MERKKQDSLNIKKWADQQAEKQREQIRAFVSDGWEKKKAVESVLESSTLGAGYKSQIRYEFK